MSDITNFGPLAKLFMPPRPPRPPWQVLTDAEVDEIARFAGIAPAKVRGVEMIVLLKTGQVKVDG